MSAPSAAQQLALHLRRQTLEQDANGYTVWKVRTETRTVAAARAALVLCDVWDAHTCRGAVERLERLLPRMNQVVRALRERGVLGVHTNMCILNRTFAIKQLVRWGFDVALIRDLTDAMYNPARPPYVSHEAGTRLVVEHIAK